MKREKAGRSWMYSLPEFQAKPLRMKSEEDKDEDVKYGLDYISPETASKIQQCYDEMVKYFKEFAQNLWNLRPDELRKKLEEREEIIHADTEGVYGEVYIDFAKFLELFSDTGFSAFVISRCLEEMEEEGYVRSGIYDGESVIIFGGWIETREERRQRKLREQGKLIVKRSKFVDENENRGNDQS